VVQNGAQHLPVLEHGSDIRDGDIVVFAYLFGDPVEQHFVVHVSCNIAVESNLPVRPNSPLLLFLGISTGSTSIEFLLILSRLVGSSVSNRPVVCSGTTTFLFKLGYLVTGSRVYDFHSLFKLSGVVWPRRR
jgi:hypothetical protein